MDKKKKKIPALRFPGFEREWEEKILLDFLIPTLRVIDKPRKKYLAIGIRSHCKGTFQKPDSDPEKIAMDKLFVVKENDLIVNITFAWEGAIALVNKEDDGGLVSHRFPTYIFNRSLVLQEYFKYVFVQKRFRFLLLMISPGGAGRNRVMSKTDFLKLKWRFPEIREQQKIADFLTAVVDKINQLTRKKTLLEQYKKGVMQKIFSQEIRFPEFEGEWEETNLGNVSEDVSYGMNSAAMPFDGENKYLRITDIDDESRRFVPRPLSSPDGLKEDKYKLKKNDLVFARTGASVGKSYLYNEQDGILFYAGFLIRFSIVNANSFFVYIQTLQDKYKKWVQVMSMRSGQPGINAEEYKSYKFHLPTLPEQQKIADFLTGIDNKIELVNTQLVKTREWKRGLLQQMFV